MKIGYLVLVYNELDYTKKTFESIKKQNQSKYSFDIYCIDNDSRKEISEELQKYCQLNQIKYLRQEKNTGYAGGNNFGWRYLRSLGYDYIFIANNDIELLDTSITENIIDKFLENDSKVSIIGTHLVDKDSNPVKYSRFHQFIMKKEKINNFNNTSLLAVPTVIGCFFCIKTDSWKSDVLFTESFFMYSEEQDLEYKLMKDGKYVTILKDVNKVVKHYGGFFDFSTQKDWAIYLNIRNCILTLRIFNRKNQFLYFLIYFLLICKFFLVYKRPIILKGFIKGVSLLNKNDELIAKDAINKIMKK